MPTISKTEVQQLITHGKLPEAIGLLRSSKVVQQNDQWNREVLLLLTRYHGWQEKRRLHELTEEDSQEIFNRITHALATACERSDEALKATCPAHDCFALHHQSAEPAASASLR